MTVRGVSDSDENPRPSGLELFEDLLALGPGHSTVQDIREKGGGRYRHWGQSIFFSTSDNSDPTSNGRTYIVRYNQEVVVLTGDPAFASQLPPPIVEDRAKETEIVMKLKAISMLGADSLMKLRAYARRSSGAILEVGPYIGGSTCAIGDAIRDSGRVFISVEQGGRYDHPQLPSRDILEDWRRNVRNWGLEQRVKLIPKLFVSALADLDQALAGARIGMVFIDADGSAGQILYALRSHLSDGCIVVLDDYGDPTKGRAVRDYIERAVSNNSLVCFETDDIKSTWFGGLVGSARLLPEPLPFIQEDGRAWFGFIPFENVSDTAEEPNRSTLELFEDSQPLGPPHSLHADIRTHGDGRYSYF